MVALRTTTLAAYIVETLHQSDLIMHPLDAAHPSPP
jgi:hypothetical protein